MTNIYFEKLDKLIIENLIEAKSDIKIAVAWITDLKIIKTLEQCIVNEVSVSIIFFNDRINNIEHFEKLFNKGAKINYTSNLMHNKFCIIDNKITLNGSYNWTNSAKSNNENIQITDSKDIALKFEEEFNKILNKSTSVDKYFEKKKNSFDQYFDKILKPKSYPNFYKIEFDKYSVKNIITYLLNDSYTTKGLNYIYKLFNTEEEFRDFFKRTYENLSQSGNHKAHLYSRVKIEEDYTDYLGKSNTFIPIDIIKEIDIQSISTLTAADYINSKQKFTNEDIIYFEDSSNIKFLIVGIYGTKKSYDLEDKLVIISLTKENGNYNLKKYEFRLLEKEDHYVIISDKPERRSYPGHYKIEYKSFLHIGTLKLDNEKSNSDLQNRKDYIEKELHKKI